MAFPQPDIIVDAFCQNGVLGTDYVDPPVSSIDPNIVTQEDGYPISQATPFNSGGVPVDRAQTNGLQRLYSSILVWLNVGGTFTFDATVATAGGYNEGAILYCASNNTFQRSLIPDNTADFVTTPSYIDDGVNWATVTATPSIYNPNLFYLSSKCVSSTLGTNCYTVFQQSEIGSGPAAGYMETEIRVNGLGGTLSSSKSSMQLGALSAIEAVQNDYIKTTTNKGIGFDKYSYSGDDKLHSDWLIFSNYSGAIVDSGLRLIEGSRPEIISADIGSLQIGTSSLTIFADNKVKTSGAFVMTAAFNGVKWGVTVGGGTNSPTIVGNVISYILDINSVFGITIPGGTGYWVGAAGIDYTGPTRKIIRNTVYLSDTGGGRLTATVELDDTPDPGSAISFSATFTASAITE